MKKTWIYLAIFIALFAVRFWVSTFSFNPDELSFQAWVNSIKTNGFENLYSRDVEPFAKPNYPPLITASFYYLDNAAHNMGITDYKIIFAFYKLPAVFTETIAIMILLLICGPFGALIAALNPGIFYNTLLWGQTEGLMASLILICLYLLSRKRPIWALFVFALSLLVKQSAVIFLPLVLIILFKNFNLKKAMLGVSVMIVSTILPFIPFAGKKFVGFAFSFFLNSSAGQEHQWQASVNALNFWFMAGLNLVRDSTTFLNLSYRFISILITIFLILVIIYLFVKRKYSLENSLLAAGLINFAVCMFLTRVHERHLLPSLLLFIPYIIKNGLSFALYAGISLIYFANLYLIWQGQFYSFNQNTLKILSFVNIIIFFYFLFLLYCQKQLSKT